MDATGKCSAFCELVQTGAYPAIRMIASTVAVLVPPGQKALNSSDLVNMQRRWVHAVNTARLAVGRYVTRYDARLRHSTCSCRSLSTRQSLLRRSTA